MYFLGLTEMAGAFVLFPQPIAVVAKAKASVIFPNIDMISE
jgi:hypothetical protein